jgi:diacylglycerol kinase
MRRSSSLLSSFRCALTGLAWAFQTQRNLRLHAAASLTAVIAGLFANFSDWKWCVLAGCIGLVVAAERLNTAIEMLCDRVIPELDEDVRRIKNVAAAAVLVCAGASLIISLLLFC